MNGSSADGPWAVIELMFTTEYSGRNYNRPLAPAKFVDWQTARAQDPGEPRPALPAATVG